MRRIISLLLCAAAILFVAPLSACNETTAENSCFLDLYYDADAGIINGKAVYKFVNSSNEMLNKIKFNLYPNAYNEKNKAFFEGCKDAYYQGESFGGIKILSCSSGENESGNTPKENLEFSVSENELTLEVLCDELLPDKSVEIAINFETTLPKARLRLGITENTVNLGECYPALCKIDENGFVPTEYHAFGDPYFSDVFDYRAEINVPSAFTVACSGSPEKTVIDGDRTNYSFSLENGRYFAFALSDKFNVSAIKSGNTDIYYYSIAPENGKIGEVRKYFDFYSSEFGEYPYKTFSVVETGLYCGGAEFSGLCFISDNGDDERKLNAALHETAHQWWGAVVGNDQTTDGYIDEGLTEYSAYLYLLSSGQTDASDNMINKAKAAYKSFFDIKSLFSSNADTSMNRPLKEYANEEEYVAIAYRKSLVMFAELEKTVGMKKNIAAMKKLYKDNKFKNIGLDELTKAFGRKEYFESFVNGKVII